MDNEIVFHGSGSREEDGTVVQPTSIVVTCDGKFIEGDELTEFIRELNELFLGK